eukprot:2808868-Rhodomonas_salina.1
MDTLLRMFGAARAPLLRRSGLADCKPDEGQQADFKRAKSDSKLENWNGFSDDRTCDHTRSDS